MIKSMTGFGLGSTTTKANRYNIEIKSLNARFLEIKFRGVQLDLLVEDEIKKILKNKLQRGTVHVRIESDLKNNPKTISFNQEKYELIKGILKDIHITYGQPMNMSDIISASDLLKLDEPKIPNKNAILKAVEVALHQLEQMRKSEGEKIFQDISNRVRVIKEVLNNLEGKLVSYKVNKHNDLRSKIEDMLNGEDIDESRLIQEVAYLIEKMDVTEEIVRCNSHFNQIKLYLETNEPVGKRINFLIQELGREINTIGSKSPQTDITIDIVEIKDELEKIREQIQNIL